MRSSRVTRPGDAAVLVDDHGQVVRVDLHLPQGVVGLLRLRHEQRRAGELLHGHGRDVEGLLVAEPRDVAQIEDAEHLIRVLADHRDARDAGAEEQAERGAHRGVVVDRDHVGARDHHLAHDRVAPFEDRVDELAIVLLEHLELGRLVDHAEQLLLAGEGRRLRPARRDPVAEGDEAVGDRAEHDPDGAHDRRREHDDALGVGAAHAARARADQHERGAGHHEGAREQDPPPVVEHLGEDERDEHGGRRLGDDAQEVEGVDVADDVGRDRDQRALRPVTRGEVDEVGAAQHA